MACSYGVADIPEFLAAKAQAAVEQPRPVTNQLSRAALPSAEPYRQIQSILLEKLPLNCRLLIWTYVLQAPYTRIERWRPSYYGSSITAYGVEALDADCFPYRLSTPDTEMHEGTKKHEKPLALLLSCRQLYAEALQLLYSSTTLVFANPTDIYCFQVTASPKGLASVNGLIIAFGKIDWPNNGPFHHEDGLKEWEHAFYNLDKMPSLRELQGWFYHGEFNNPKELVWARRPWDERMESEAVEQRHKRLFDLFGNVDVPSFTINLTWKPEDLLSQRAWPFEINVQTNDEIFRRMLKFPYPIELDMYS
ncbi:uncharacterized protein K460DRAFT_414641 [Cucurbitaria berberidis CBS 394.84]|uniref:DUF7730 domain-containing protein n=1 Tax=Cucurbitaria berberidis CBS 394.84 TaxID=1168544 RepID=A0A9P4GM73_9PLEO|nr:uncharacterized protein K460DRAFT_414641 [Cucurbitaria berberidis CBS 394.84]KAF1848009.1 hypothetical protein K460DRAFT_414641 [Cucurbitaria berberidis CBS 394.84]